MIDLLFTTFLIAQEYPGCFMVTPQGQYIDLTHNVCRYEEQQFQRQLQQSNINSSNEKDLFLFDFKYNYCLAVKDGIPAEQARTEAIEATIQSRSLGSFIVPEDTPDPYSPDEETLSRLNSITLSDIPCRSILRQGDSVN